MKTIRQLVLPYCVVLLESGRIVLLNRDYRHLGESRSSRWMPHEEFWGAYLEKVALKCEGVSREALDEICGKPLRQEWTDREVHIGWLYDDATIPTSSKACWTAYSARLEKIMKFGDKATERKSR